LQNILQYITKDRDTCTYITEIEKNLGECGKLRSNVYRGPWHTAVIRPQIAMKKKFVPQIGMKKIIVPQIATIKSLKLRPVCKVFFSVAAHLGIGARFATTEIQ
jgi:hypothetical protein